MNVDSDRRITSVDGLTSGAYKDDSLLRKRKALYEFTEPYYNIEDEILRLLALQGSNRLLDVGCGEGQLLFKARDQYPTVSLTGMDISPGIMKKIKKKNVQDNLGIDLAVGDIQQIPFPNDTFDRVTSIHMLYHVPNIEKALQETLRVLKTPGTAIFTTNSSLSKPILKALKEEVSKSLSLGFFPDIDSRFNIENGPAILKQFFSNVDLIQFRSTLNLYDVQPYVDYFDSLREFYNPYPTDNVWKNALMMVKEVVGREIKDNGSFKETNLFGIFVAKV